MMVKWIFHSTNDVMKLEWNTRSGQTYRQEWICTIQCNTPHTPAPTLGHPLGLLRLTCRYPKFSNKSWVSKPWPYTGPGLATGLSKYKPVRQRGLKIDPGKVCFCKFLCIWIWNLSAQSTIWAASKLLSSCDSSQQGCKLQLNLVWSAGVVLSLTQPKLFVVSQPKPSVSGSVVRPSPHVFIYSTCKWIHGLALSFYSYSFKNDMIWECFPSLLSIRFDQN